MSFTATNWAYGQRCRNGTAKAVLAYLANCADQNGECFPGLANICKAVQHGEVAVKRAIVALIEDRQLDRERRRTANGRDTSYRYRLPVAVVRVDPTPAKSHPHEGSEIVPHPAQGGVRNRRGEGYDSAGESITVPTEELRSSVSKKERQEKRTQLPEGWLPGPEGVAYAEEHGLSEVLADQVERFRDYHTARGNRMQSWDAAWRTWCRNAQKWRKTDQPDLMQRDPSKLSGAGLLKYRFRQERMAAQEAEANQPLLRECAA